MELFTAIPTRRTRDMSTAMEITCRATRSAAATPTTTRGTASMTVSGWMKERNWATRSR
jgi:hypothetical protein